MTRRSQMLKDKRQPPMDEAIYWIEHAIKYPNMLTPKSAQQPFWVLHQIDVLVFLLIVIPILVLTLGNRLSRAVLLLSANITVKLKQS